MARFQIRLQTCCAASNNIARSFALQVCSKPLPAQGRRRRHLSARGAPERQLRRRPASPRGPGEDKREPNAATERSPSPARNVQSTARWQGLPLTLQHFAIIQLGERSTQDLKAPGSRHAAEEAQKLHGLAHLGHAPREEILALRPQAARVKPTRPSSDWATAPLRRNRRFAKSEEGGGGRRGARCNGIAPASLAEGPGVKQQRAHGFVCERAARNNGARRWALFPGWGNSPAILPPTPNARAQLGGANGATEKGRQNNHPKLGRDPAITRFSAARSTDCAGRAAGIETANARSASSNDQLEESSDTSRTPRAGQTPTIGSRRRNNPFWNPSQTGHGNGLLHCAVRRRWRALMARSKS